MKKTTLTIKRPCGKIEIVDISEKFENGLTDSMFNQIKAATKAAGRGDCLSYEMISEELTDEQKYRIEQGKKRMGWFRKNGFESGNFN